MKTYSEFRPTEFDRPGAFIGETRGTWLVAPVGQNRDSRNTEKSNFAATLELLGGESDDVEVHRFSHWAVGWLETILVRPETNASREAEKIEARLENYPLLNEDDVSRREHDEYNDAWVSWGSAEFVADLVKKFELSDETAERLEDADKETLQTFFEGLNPSGDYQDDGAPVIRRSINNATETDMDEFLESLPPPAPGHTVP